MATRPAIGFKRILSDRRRPTRPGEALVSNARILYARWDGNPARPPKKGELFISGAIPHAYEAKADLTTEYFIAVIVED